MFRTLMMLIMIISHEKGTMAVGIAALREAVDQGRVKHGDKVVVSGAKKGMNGDCTVYVMDIDFDAIDIRAVAHKTFYVVRHHQVGGQGIYVGTYKGEDFSLYAHKIGFGYNDWNIHSERADPGSAHVDYGF